MSSHPNSGESSCSVASSRSVLKRGARISALHSTLFNAYTSSSRKYAGLMLTSTRPAFAVRVGSAPTRRSSATRCPGGRLARARGVSDRARARRRAASVPHRSTARPDAERPTPRARGCASATCRTCRRSWRRSAADRTRPAHSSKGIHDVLVLAAGHVRRPA